MVATKMTGTARKSARTDVEEEPQRRLFTIDEYVRMAEVRILGLTERTELVEGEIYQMAAMHSPHAKYLGIATDWWYAHRPAAVIIRVQAPVALPPRSMPEPDLAIVRHRDDRYGSGHPGPGEILLVIEISDTSLAYDRGIKQRVYALAELPDYVILDVKHQQFIVHRKPEGARYIDVTTVGRGGTITPVAFPDIALAVDDIFA